MKICSTLLFAIGFSLSLSAQKTYIQCGRLIDGLSNSVRQSVTIVIEENKIKAIENGYTSGSGDRYAASVIYLAADCIIL